MNPIVFETTLFGFLSKPFSLHWYGLLIAMGFWVSMLYARRQAARENEDPEKVQDMAFWLLLFGLMGARFIFILTRWDVYMQNPLKILTFWEGGFVFYGGFIGAAFTLIYYTTVHKLPFFKYADLLIPFLAMAHAVGRLGCLMAGCCFGEPTEMAWGIQFPSGSACHVQHLRLGDVGANDPSLAVHPTQLYEAVAELIMFFYLSWLRMRKRFHGQVLLAWLIGYPIIRSVIEMYRGDKIRGIYKLIEADWFPAMSTSQYISILVALSAVGTWLYLRRTHAKPLLVSSDS